MTRPNHRIFCAALLMLSLPYLCLAQQKEDATVYRRVLKVMPLQLDPALTDFGHEVQVIRQMYDQLVTYDKGYSLRPMLAESWSVSRDGKRYSFKLKPNVRFSDGLPLTVEDVVFSLERVIKAPDSKYFRDFLLISGAKSFRSGAAERVSGLKVSGNDLEIELDIANPYFLAILASPAGSVIQKKAFANLPAGQPHVGSGPFVFEGKTKDTLTLKANPSYYAGAAKLSRIIYKVYQDRGAMEKDFLSGKLDDIAPYNLPQGADKNNFRRVFTNGIITFIAVVNPDSTSLVKKEVRQAVVMSFDFDDILKNLQDKYPYLSRSRSYVPKGRPSYDSAFKGLGYAPDRAVAKLNAVGYEGFHQVPPLRLFYTGNLPYTAEILDGMKKYCARSGLDCRFERNSGLQMGKNDWDMKIIGLDTVYPDTYFLLRYFHSRSSDLSLRRNDKKTDELIEKCETELNPLKRHLLFQEINMIAVNEAYVVPLYSGDIFDGYFRKWVSGVRYPMTAYYDLPLYYMHIDSVAGKDRPKLD